VGCVKIAAMRSTVISFLLASLAAGAFLSARGETPMSAERRQIDHVIVGTADLGRGIEEFQQLTGVKPIAGGVHPGRGTHNALVALDKGRYLEILAPMPDAPPSAYLDRLRTLKTLTPFGWAVSTNDPDATIRLLKDAGYDVTGRMPGSRVKADGTRLDWVSFGITPELEQVPFFISWSASTQHPSVDSPAGCSLAAIAIDVPAQASTSRRLLDLLLVGVDVKSGEAPRMQLTLQCPKGIVRLG